MLSPNNQYTINNPYAYAFQAKQINKHHTHKIIAIDIIIAIIIFFIISGASLITVNKIQTNKLQANVKVMQAQELKYIHADKIGLGPKLGKAIFHKVHFSGEILTIESSPAYVANISRYRQSLNNPRLESHLIKTRNSIIDAIELTRAKDILTQQLQSNMNLPKKKLEDITPIINFSNLPTINDYVSELDYPLDSELTPSLKSKYVNNPDKLLRNEQHTHSHFLLLSKRYQAFKNKETIHSIEKRDLNKKQE